MVSKWERIKVYTKLSFVCLVILAGIMFIGSNRDPVKIKFLGWTLVETWAWLVIVLAGLVGVGVCVVFGRTSTVLRDVRRLRQESKAAKSNASDDDQSS